MASREARMTPAAFDELPEDMKTLINRIMPPDMPPFSLFTTLARDPRLFDRFVAKGLMGKGNLTLRQRELIVDRVTARCGSEYEWGIHVAFFGDKLFDEAQIYSIVHGGADDACWPDEDKIIIRLCDGLEANCTVGDDLYADLQTVLTDQGIIEAILLVGNYRTTACLTETLRLPLEPFGRRFPAK